MSVAARNPIGSLPETCGTRRGGNAMITKFDSSYVGSVDLEDVGYLGKPINERCYSNEQLAEVMHKTVTYAKQMDRLGYEALWMAEHHFQPEGTECIPNLLMMATHLCGVTRNLK